MGRPETYLAAHRDLLAGRVDVFDQPGRPVLTRWPERAPARVVDGAEVGTSLLSPGCVVEGTVRRSVLSPGVRVARGAVVEDCVLLDDVVVEAGARVGTAVVDSGVVVGRDARVGEVSGRRSPRVGGDHAGRAGLPHPAQGRPAGRRQAGARHDRLTRGQLSRAGSVSPRPSSCRAGA